MNKNESKWTVSTTCTSAFVICTICRLKPAYAHTHFQSYLYAGDRCN